MRPELETPWWYRCDELAALYLYLVDNALLDPSDSREVAYMLSKPWKWSAERDAMLARRTANDADDLDHEDDLPDALEASVAHARAQRPARKEAREMAMAAVQVRRRA